MSERTDEGRSTLATVERDGGGRGSTSQGGGEPKPTGGKRLAAAFAVAVVADLASALLTVTPPVQWAVDLVTAVSLFVLLGRRWALLPALIAEAIPGVSVFPFWVLVVGSIALWGSVRRSRDAEPRPGGEGPRSLGAGRNP